MRCTAFVFLVILGLIAPKYGLCEDVLFKDDFKQDLSSQWQAVRLGKTDYRVRDGGLEMRVQPGKLTNETPSLNVVLPFTSAETVTVSVKVILLNDFTQDHEFAGVFLFDETGREFAATKERIDGRLVYAPGDYHFEGKTGEEENRSKYVVQYTPAKEEAGHLRIVVDRGTAFFQVGPGAKGKYLNFFNSALRKTSKQMGVCLTAAGAPKSASHWVRFEEFRVFRP